MRPSRLIFAVSIPLMIILIMGCSTSNNNITGADNSYRSMPPASSIVKGNGTIVFKTFEGGFYAIQGDDSSHWDPRNLPDDFKKDGLRVYFEGVRSADQIGFHMWGVIIDITKIERLIPLYDSAK